MLYDFKKISEGIDEVIKVLPYFSTDEVLDLLDIKKKIRTAFLYAEMKKIFEQKGYFLYYGYNHQEKNHYKWKLYSR